MQKGYGTVDSRVVAHPSTNTAWRSLTSLFGWEAVLSAQYGRIQQPRPSPPLPAPPNSDWWPPQGHAPAGCVHHMLPTTARASRRTFFARFPSTSRRSFATLMTTSASSHVDLMVLAC